MKLEEMKQIAARRSPGTWKSYVIQDSYGNNDHGCGPGHGADQFYAGIEDPSSPEEDAEFIAMASNNWDKLMAVVEAGKHINDSMGHWFLNPDGPTALRAAFRKFEEALEELEEGE